MSLLLPFVSLCIDIITIYSVNRVFEIIWLKAKIQQEQFKVKLFSTQQIMAIYFPLS